MSVAVKLQNESRVPAAEAAAKCGLSKRKLIRHILSGKLDGVLGFGRYGWWTSEEAIQRFLCQMDQPAVDVKVKNVRR